MPGEPLRLDGYIRVSKIGGREGDGFISPDVQRDQIRSWANLMGAEIIEWHEDLDYSGSNTDRPGFQSALERTLGGETGGIVVARIDRFARSSIDGGRVVKQIIGAGGVFASAQERLDPTTPIGEAMLTIMFAMAQLDLRRIQEGWDAATGRAIARGVHGKTPFGYRKSAGNGSPLEPDPETARFVPELFRRRSTGESWTALAEWLNGRVQPRHGGMWTRRAVETIIRNPVYRGEARYGHHRNPQAHEPLVGADLWHAAQAAAGLRPARGVPGLLSGLVRCAGCRHRLQPATVGQTKAKVYRCKRTHNAGTCASPAYIVRASLEEHVEVAFLARYGNVSLEGKVGNAGLEDARQRVADAESELAAYRDNTAIRLTLERLGEGQFEAGLAARADAVLEARNAFQRARRETAGIDLGPGLAVWPQLGVPERRRLLAEGVDAVFLRRAVNGRHTPIADRVRIFWRGEAPNDLPGPGIRVELRGIDW